MAPMAAGLFFVVLRRAAIVCPIVAQSEENLLNKQSPQWNMSCSVSALDDPVVSYSYEYTYTIYLSEIATFLKRFFVFTFDYRFKSN